MRRKLFAMKLPLLNGRDQLADNKNRGMRILLFGYRPWPLSDPDYTTWTGPSEAADDRLGCFRPRRFYGNSDDHEIACVLQLIDSEKQAYAMAFQAHQLEVTENGVTQARRAIPYRNLGVGAIMNVFQGTSSNENISVTS